MQPKHDKPGSGAVAVLDAVITLVAEDEAEDGQSTPDQARWAHGVAQAVAIRVAELRRQLTPVRPVTNVPHRLARRFAHSTAWDYLRDWRLCAKVSRFGTHIRI